MRRMSTTTTTATATTSTSAEDTSRAIPFSCTGCGKCCQTIGSVYLSPDDVAQASKHLNLSPQQFIRTYASHTIQNAVKGAVTTTKDAATTSSSATTPWVVLRDSTNKEDAAAGASCIFLDTDTNQCQIYEARPAQCRTYPFWPSIVASVQDWNDECRRKGGDSDGPSYGAHNALLPEWTPEAGGCEGMRPIQIDPKNDDRWIAQDLASSFLSSSSSPPLSPSLSPESFTSTDEAIRCLYQYVQDHRRFPHGADEVPVSAAAPE